MQVDLKNKNFFFSDTVVFIFEEILKKRFLHLKGKRLDVGYIKWIYEKSDEDCQGMTFDEDEFFRFILEKEIDYFGDSFFIDSNIYTDKNNFKTIKINLYIPNLNTDFDFIKRQLINHIARNIFKLSEETPFLRKVENYNKDFYTVRNEYIDFDSLLKLNIGFRAESLYYNICFIKCIKDYLKFIKCDLTVFDKNIYSIKNEDYDILCKDIVNCFY